VQASARQARILKAFAQRQREFAAEDAEEDPRAEEREGGEDAHDAAAAGERAEEAARRSKWALLPDVGEGAVCALCRDGERADELCLVGLRQDVYTLAADESLAFEGELAQVEALCEHAQQFRQDHSPLACVRTLRQVLCVGGRRARLTPCSLARRFGTSAGPSVLVHSCGHHVHQSCAAEYRRTLATQDPGLFREPPLVCCRPPLPAR
jgi:hypothetical protein